MSKILIRLFYTPLHSLIEALRGHHFTAWYHEHSTQFWAAVGGSIAANSDIATPAWWVLTDADLHAIMLGVLAVLGKAIVGGVAGGSAGTVLQWSGQRVIQFKNWIASKARK